MSDAPWFFHEELPPQGGSVWIPRDEARHVTGARRLRAGDAVTFTDGRGGTAGGTLTDERDRQGMLRVEVAPRAQHARRGRPVTVATALPKGDRAATLLEAMGPLGVVRVHVLDCEFGVAGLTPHQRIRAQRILQEGCKQSRQPWVPVLTGPGPVDAAIVEAGQCGAMPILLDPAGDPMGTALASTATDSALWVFVGPEGGFSSTERSAAVAAGARAVRLDCGILRVELAATVAAALACGVGEWSVPGSNR